MISDPATGSRHDAHCLDESGVLLAFDPGTWIGDKGYVGKDMITPIKKPEHHDLLDWEKEFKKQVNKIRFATLSSRSLPTSRPGGSCTRTTAGR